jgi:hypothetical protein
MTGSSPPRYRAPLLHRQSVGLAGTQLVQPVVALHRHPQRPGHVLGGLQRARERAADESVGTQRLGRQPLLQQAGLLPTPLGQPPVTAHPADHRLDVGHGLAVPHQEQLRRHK